MIAACLALWVVLPAGAQARHDATLVVVVIDGATAGPLSYADVAVEDPFRERLASAKGVARLDGLPVSRVDVRVRRVGYTPARRSISLTGSDTLRITLERLVIRLPEVTATDAVCPARPGGDTLTLTVIEQMRLNADRARILGASYPFSSRVERVVSDEGSPRRQIDTVAVAGLPPWEYEPGNLIFRSGDPGDPNSERMALPQLVHLASDQFIAAHCFRYAGRRELEGTDRIRLDFEPASTLKAPDVRGSIYLDTASYRLVAASMALDRPMGVGSVMQVRVESRYVEVLPGLSVAEQICARTTVRRESSTQRGVALEGQRVLIVEFSGDSPGAPSYEVNARPCRR